MFSCKHDQNNRTPNDEETVPLEIAHFKAVAVTYLIQVKYIVLLIIMDSEGIHLIASLSKDTIQAFQ